MTKIEFISRYGEDAYELRKQKIRKWHEEHKEQHNKQNRNWHKEHKKQCKLTHRIWNEEQRKKGSTPYCRENYELIENYELAKADNFDPKKWHLHHRLENYWSKATLERKGLYDNVNPEALIWLPYKEHKKDTGLSTLYPERTKWHKRILE